MIKSPEEAYIFGLWCADGYHRTSSIGLSNINPKLIDRFGTYLEERFPKDRLRLRVYLPNNATADKRLISKYRRVSILSVRKARHASYHVYVNCRSMLRDFTEAKKHMEAISKGFIIPYLAGRFDGDGSVNSNLKKDFRIVYGNRREAELDKTLLSRIKPYRASSYHYKRANTYCLYISQKDAPLLVRDLTPYSLNLQKISLPIPRRD